METGYTPTHASHKHTHTYTHGHFSYFASVTFTGFVYVSTFNLETSKRGSWLNEWNGMTSLMDRWWLLLFSLLQPFRARLEELRMFLENETWELCPVKSNFNIAQLHVSKNHITDEGKRSMAAFVTHCTPPHPPLWNMHKDVKHRGFCSAICCTAHYVTQIKIKQPLSLVACMFRGFLFPTLMSNSWKIEIWTPEPRCRSCTSTTKRVAWMSSQR